MHILCAYTAPVQCILRHNYTQPLKRFSTQELCALAIDLEIDYCVPFFMQQKVDGLELVLSTEEEFLSRLTTTTGRALFISFTFLDLTFAAIADAAALRRRGQSQGLEGVDTLTTASFVLQISRCKQIRKSLLYRVIRRIPLLLAMTHRTCPLADLMHSIIVLNLAEHKGSRRRHRRIQTWIRAAQINKRCS